MTFLHKVWAQLVLVWHVAKDKWTCWLAAVVASSGAARAMWPDLVSYLPNWHWLSVLEQWVFVALGALFFFSRIRRLLTQAPDQGA